MHDTYFVVAHFHIVMGASAIFGMFAGIYHWFPKMFGRMMNKTLGYVHFWFTMIAVYGIFFPMHFLGLAGVPRRYYSNEAFEMFNNLIDINVLITCLGNRLLKKIVLIMGCKHFAGNKSQDK